MDSQCPWCLGQAVVTLRLPCAIVESPWRHKRVPFINITFLRSRSIKRRQWKHKLDYYGVVFAHLTTGCGIKAKDPSGLDSDRWIPHSRCCENPAWAKALAGFSRHLSAGFTDLNPCPRGLSLYNVIPPFPPQQALFLPPISARARTAAGVQTAPYLHAGSLAGVSWSRKYSQVNWTRVFLKSILVWVEEEKYSWFIIQSRWRVLKYVLNILVVNYICVDVDNGKVFSCIIIIQTMLVCAKINLKVEKKCMKQNYD